jgi:flagellar hook-basal body complex protein FliE
MSVSGIESIGGFKPLATPQLDAASGVKNAGATSPVADGGEFGNLVLDGIDRLQSVQQTSDQLAVKAATGDLDALHHYTIAASEAAVTTQLTVAVRNKALDAFNEIMRMPV